MNSRLRMWLISLALGLAGNVGALTLEEYGITATGNGIVDQVTGLRWLDSGLTDGDRDDLQGWLDQGWRIATEAEFFFLVTREAGRDSGAAVSELGFDEFGWLAERLSYSLNQEFSGPWLCRDYGDPERFCRSTQSFGGQFTLLAEPLDGGQMTSLSVFLYLSEVPMYGAFDCDFRPCDYEGRSLMVRAVPLPAAGWLLAGGLALLAGRYRGAPGGPDSATRRD